MKLSNEVKVGALILLTAALAVGFVRALGLGGGFSDSVHFYVTYDFAGGIDVGSPVRVSGIKVGRVEQIQFFQPIDPKLVSIKEPGSDALDDGTPGKAITPLKLKVSVRKDAAVGVRKDSRFYINLAGLIGERYVEVTPGHWDQPQITAGDTVAGVNPPRIDQLLSQSFDLAGKIKDIIDENKGDITKSIDLLYKLSGNINKTLSWVDKSAVFKTDLAKLVENLIQITSDVRRVTDRTHSPEGEKTLKLMYDLLWRLEPFDKDAIRNFLQKEGVRVHFF